MNAPMGRGTVKLAIKGLLTAVLLWAAFMANPGLNGLILGVLALIPIGLSRRVDL